MRSLRRLIRPAGLLTLTLMGAAVTVGCASLDERQRAWIFQPGKATWGGGAVAADGMDEVWIDYRDTQDRPVRLNGLWLDQPQADAPVLLYLHGARWNVRSSAMRMRRLHSLGYAVLGIDYRGFGLSTDELPSEQSAIEDARAAWDWLARERPGRSRTVFGHSLGGAIAVALAAQVDDEAGVIVEGTFTSIPDVVSSFRWGWLPVGPLITQRFEAVEQVDRIGSPLLVVHGSEDRLIPPELGRALYERAREPKRYVLVEGGSHHNTNAVGLDRYREAVAELFGLAAPADSPGAAR
ncbi:alpha/beta hydrolase [Sphaerotilus mobilis]|nr:alpha/beta fold hydrolase [Sphaerotilus mobilis]